MHQKGHYPIMSRSYVEKQHDDIKKLKIRNEMLLKRMQTLQSRQQNMFLLGMIAIALFVYFFIYRR